MASGDPICVCGRFVANHDASRCLPRCATGNGALYGESILMDIPKGSNPMTEKQAERMIEAVKEQTVAIQELRREIVSPYNRIGALLPGER